MSNVHSNEHRVQNMKMKKGEERNKMKQFILACISWNEFHGDIFQLKMDKKLGFRSAMNIPCLDAAELVTIQPIKFHQNQKRIVLDRIFENDADQ